MADGSHISQKSIDLITIGRSSADLYGQQIGSSLEDTSSFSKSVGGCPSNIAIGTARLGLKAAVITRVGDEAMGRGKDRLAIGQTEPNTSSWPQ